jgi:ketosteroid isomerase-like protein
MERSRGHRPALLAPVVMALLVAACQPRSVPAPDRSADAAVIRELLETIAADFNARRYDDMLGHYQDDVVVLAPGRPDIVGKAAWREVLASSLPEEGDMKLRFDTEELSIDGNLAYERGTYLVEITTGDGLMQIEGRHIHIFLRQRDGSWKGWRLMENSSDPSTAPPPLPVRP